MLSAAAVLTSTVVQSQDDDLSKEIGHSAHISSQRKNNDPPLLCFRGPI